jgi:dTDP-4-amino-4,6-dideoxygalactose transaminase
LQTTIKQIDAMINVTNTFFPPIEEYTAQLHRIWENKWLTNRGALVKELEKNLSDYLSLEECKILIMNNGTIPIQIALKLLAKSGEVITTPFSYVATTAAIVWENCTPVFVDIHPEYLTIDETKIEAAITDKTTCILATHVFGNSCNIEAIDEIANKYQLKVIYDAAHSFGVTYRGKSIFEYGDISTCSFHATKLFHTGEGGALFSKQSELFNQSFYSHNFGHDGPLAFHRLGINGKLSELQAAMGLVNLAHMPSIIRSREEAVALYERNLNFSKLKKIRLREGIRWNYSYFPIIFESETVLLEAQRALNSVEIFPRRYFYPSLNKLKYVKGSTMRISEEVSSKILCLPLYYNLMENDILNIANTVNKIL